jgi:hypothetical protein
MNGWSLRRTYQVWDPETEEYDYPEGLPACRRVRACSIQGAGDAGAVAGRAFHPDPPDQPIRGQKFDRAGIPAGIAGDSASPMTLPTAVSTAT